MFGIVETVGYNHYMDRISEFSVSVGTLLKIAFVGIGLYLVFFFRDLVLIVLTAVVLASALEPAIKMLQRWYMPRIAAVASVFALVMLVLVFIGITLLPRLAGEVAYFSNDLPTYLESVHVWLNTQAENSQFINNVLEVGDVSISEMFNNLSKTVGFAASSLAYMLSVLFSSIVTVLLILILSFYFASQEYGIDNFLKIVVSPKYSKYAVNLWRRSQRKIGLWMQGQMLMMLMTGTIVYIGLSIIGVSYPFILKYALLLALLAALAELIPVAGAFLSAVPAVILALVGGGIPAALVVAGFYLVYQQIQGNLVYPMVVNKVVGVPPLLVLIGLIVGAQLFGVLGAILSVPFAAALMEYVKDVEREHTQEIVRRKKKESELAEQIALKIVEKTEEKDMPRRA